MGDEIKIPGAACVFERIVCQRASGPSCVARPWHSCHSTDAPRRGVLLDGCPDIDLTRIQFPKYVIKLVVFICDGKGAGGSGTARSESAAPMYDRWQVQLDCCSGRVLLVFREGNIRRSLMMSGLRAR